MAKVIRLPLLGGTLCHMILQQEWKLSKTVKSSTYNGSKLHSKWDPPQRQWFSTCSQETEAPPSSTVYCTIATVYRLFPLSVPPCHCVKLAQAPSLSALQLEGKSRAVLHGHRQWCCRNISWCTIPASILVFNMAVPMGSGVTWLSLARHNSEGNYCARGDIQEPLYVLLSVWPATCRIAEHRWCIPESSVMTCWLLSVSRTQLGLSQPAWETSQSPS